MVVVELLSVCAATFLAIAGLSWATEAAKFDIKGKVVVVTGGSSGIGKAVSKVAAARGSHVALIARGKAALDGKCSWCRIFFFKVRTLPTLTRRGAGRG